MSKKRKSLSESSSSSSSLALKQSKLTSFSVHPHSFHSRPKMEETEHKTAQKIVLQSSLSFKPFNSLHTSLELKKEEYAEESKNWLKEYPKAKEEIGKLFTSHSETIQFGDSFEWKVTQEQKELIENPVFRSLSSTKESICQICVAGAGCGKTHTLIPLTKKYADKKFLYVAFNNSIVKEARSKMKKHAIENVEVHSLSGFAYKIKVIEQGYEFLEDSVEWESRLMQLFFERRNTYISKDLMFSVIEGFQKFCRSSDLAVEEKHVVSLSEQSNQHFYSSHELKKRKEKKLELIRSNLTEQKDVPEVEKHAERISEAFPKQMKIIIETIWKWTKEKLLPLSYSSLTKLLQHDKQKDKLHERFDFCLVDEVQDLKDVDIDILTRPWILLGIGDVCQTVNEWAGVKDPLKKLPFSRMFYLTESFRFSHSVALFFNLSAQLVGVHNLPLIRPLKGCAPNITDIRPFTFQTSTQKHKYRTWKNFSTFWAECFGDKEDAETQVLQFGSPIGILSRNNLDMFELMLSPSFFFWIRTQKIQVILQDSLCQYFLDLLRLFLLSDQELKEEYHLAILADQHYWKRKIEWVQSQHAQAGLITRQIRFILHARIKNEEHTVEGEPKFIVPPVQEKEREWNQHFEACCIKVSLEEIDGWVPNQEKCPQFFFSTIHTSKGMEFQGVILMDNITHLLFQAACLKDTEFLHCRQLSLASTLNWIEQEIKRSRTRKPSFSNMCLFTVAITRAIRCMCLPPALYDLFQALVILETEKQTNKVQEEEDLRKMLSLATHD